MTAPAPTRPGPDGEQPPDWPDNWWAAWVILQRGGARSEAGAAVGRSVATISKWVATWRAWWGQDVVPNRWQGPLRTGHKVPYAVAEIAASSRIAQANLFGATAEQAARIISARLTQLSESPHMLAEMNARDLVDLGRVVVMLNQQAATIYGENQSQGGGPHGGTRWDADMAGLEVGDGDHQTLDAARLVILEWHESKGTDPTDAVIDVDEASG